MSKDAVTTYNEYQIIALFPWTLNTKKNVGKLNSFDTITPTTRQTESVFVHVQVPVDVDVDVVRTYFT